MTILTTTTSSPATVTNGLRPVNLRTDLAPLADLIELAFRETMDSSGRAAINEMRMLSRMGVGLSVLSGMNELTQGISLGFVWVEDGQLIGNVSVYPAHWKPSLGNAWILANVAVHPAYRGRGIASRLIAASLELINERKGTIAHLQVEADNELAQHLYTKHGFTAERTWHYWKRSTYAAPPVDTAPSANINYPRRRDWHGVYALAQRTRPTEQGGLGWQKPLHPDLFKRSLWKQLTDWLTMRNIEHFIIRDANDEHAIAASLQIEGGLALGNTQLTLMVDPAYSGIYDEAMIALAVRRFGENRPLTIEHPADDINANITLRQYHFRPLRTLVQMRWQP